MHSIRYKQNVVWKSLMGRRMRMDADWLEEWSVSVTWVFILSPSSHPSLLRQVWQKVWRLKTKIFLPLWPTGLQLDSAKGRQHETMEGERREKAHFPSSIIVNTFVSKSSIYSTTTVTALMEAAALVEETRFSRNLKQTWNRWPWSP